MADNVELPSGSGGAIVATDDDGVAHHQYVKLEFGADNTQTKVSSANPLPVVAAANSGVDIGDVTINNAAGASGVPVQGGAATDAAVAGNPLLSGARASAAAPTDVSADGDAVPLWATLKGALNIADGGGTITVDGTVTASGPLTDAELRAVAVPVSGTVAVTNAGLTELAAAINGSSQMDVNIAASVGLVVDLGANNDVTVTGTVDLGATDNAVLDAIAASVAAIDADATTIIGHVDGIEGLLGTIDADTGSILTAVQLIDDTVQVLGTDTYTETTSKGITMGAVRRDADTTLVSTTNEFGPLQMDANGRLKVEAFSGEALPVTMTSTTITGTVAVTQSGSWDEVGINDSGNSITVDWAGSAPPIGAGVEATALRVTLATDSTGVVSVDDGGGVITVDGTVAVTNGGTFATQVDGAALTALQLIDNPVLVDDAAFTPATSSVMMAGFEADETGTDSVDEGDAGAARMTLDRKQIVTVQPHTAGGLTTFMASGSDGSSILVATAQVIKATAGQLYGYYAYNPEAAVSFVHFYNTAAASVTVGTTNPMFSIAIPAGSAANLSIPQGILFSNAGWSCAATTTAGGNTAPATGVSLVAWYA